MAEYLIQDTTLDAIADAINAKTGGSSAMTPAEMVTAIGSISGGGGGLSLLASGSYTLASQSSIVISIPVSFSGNPVNVFVIYRGDGTGVAHTHAWGFMASLPTSELESIFDTASDKGVKSAICITANGTTTLGNPLRARMESNNTIIAVRQISSGYPCLAGQYDWYIYGEAAS